MQNQTVTITEIRNYAQQLLIDSAASPDEIKSAMTICGVQKINRLAAADYPLFMTMLQRIGENH